MSNFQDVRGYQSTKKLNKIFFWWKASKVHDLKRELNVFVSIIILKIKFIDKKPWRIPIIWAIIQVSVPKTEKTTSLLVATACFFTGVLWKGFTLFYPFFHALTCQKTTFSSSNTLILIKGF